MSSRKRRHYVTRCLYVTILLLLFFFMWLESPVRTGGAYRTQRIAEIGSIMTAMVTWSQFILCQIITAVLLSTAISDEIYNKTLGVLMTTPITSLQIVMGKLLSKLIQCVLLVAVSLPVLAIVRVFGGIPWGYVLCCFCVTLSVSVFVGSLSLFYSISQRKAYVAIMQTIATMVILFLLIPLGVAWGMDRYWHIRPQQIMPYIVGSNPYVVMGMAMEWLMSPRSHNIQLMQYWPWHCLVLLLGSSLLLLWSIIRVRKVALYQIAGQTSAAKPKAKTRPKRVRRSWIIRSMGTWPILWKDLQSPVLGSKKLWKKIVSGILLLGILGFVYTSMVLEDAIDEEGAHIMLGIMYGAMALVYTIVISATCITSEKESRSWPVLLGTAQSDTRILVSKWLAMLRWSLPFWVLLFAHVIVFVCLGIVHPFAVFFYLIVAIGLINLCIGTGIFWSTLMRKTTTAVVCNFIVPVVLWAAIPFFLVLLAAMAGGSDDGLEFYMNAHPFFHLGAIMDACVMPGADFKIHLISGTATTGEFTALLLFCSIVNSIIGLTSARVAKSLFRKRIF